jgi:hypothetical protein
LDTPAYAPAKPKESGRGGSDFQESVAAAGCASEPRAGWLAGAAADVTALAEAISEKVITAQSVKRIRRFLLRR